MAVERIGHIGDGQRRSIVEAYPAPQPDGPVACILALDRLGQGRLRARVCIQAGEPVIDHRAAAEIGHHGLARGVHRVGGRADRDRDPQPATLRLGPRRGEAACAQPERKSAAADQADRIAPPDQCRQS